jgi:hypothetical protein
MNFMCCWHVADVEAPPKFSGEASRASGEFIFAAEQKQLSSLERRTTPNDFQTLFGHCVEASKKRLQRVDKRDCLNRRTCPRSVWMPGFKIT